MSASIASAVATADLIEIGLMLAGAVALVWAQFSAATAASRRAPFALPAWPVSPVHFLAIALCVVMGGFFAQSLVSLPTDRLPHALTSNTQLWTVLHNSALQLGLLAGLLASRLLPFSLPSAEGRDGPPGRPLDYTNAEALHGGPSGPALPRSRIWPVAIAVFLIVLTLTTLLGYASKITLNLLGAPTGEQDLIGTFRDIHSRPVLLLLITVATVVAPAVEELIFRAGLFRYLRTRISRWPALLLPAALFASLHGNAVAFLPLMALAVVFSLAYERTGRISVTIIAHGLFNLHTILLIMAGVSS